ncbi:MAG: ABC transporter ATP-binding protein, partial [Candidatus Lokiarchaeota archaeon]|nr:ABC transporter ATP-binding protein [Candidatus Lokiarchaeota archaeon]
MKFRYRTRDIINDISLNFDKGHLYGIIGPNGCGKTTFLKLISGILKKKYGQIYLEEINLNKLSIREVAKHLAMVDQLNYIEFDYKVREIIKMGRYTHINRFSSESTEDKEIVEEIIKKLGLSELADRGFNQLSGGEQQKVVIARSLAQKTNILLLDEPTSHLDINYQLEFMELFKQYVKEGLVVVIVLHDLNISAQFCDKLILMNEGRVIEFGDAKKVLTRENIKKIYGIDVIIKNNFYTNSINIIPVESKKNGEENLLKQELDSSIKKIHVIGGGGSAIGFLHDLKNYRVSLGVVNVFDDDYILAKNLGIQIIKEEPFSEISKESLNKLNEILNNVDLVILPNLPFGMGNLGNLKALNNFKKKIIIIEETPIEIRDFTGGIATS